MSRNNIHFLVIITAFVLIVFVSGAALLYMHSHNNAPPVSKKYINITDMDGRVVTVPLNAERVVAVGPGCLRLMVYLNATDKVVGVEDIEKKWVPYGRPYRLAHPELADLPVIGEGGPSFTPNIEAIVKVKPDVIFATYLDAYSANEIQKKTGIPVVVLSYGKLALFDTKPFFKSLEIAGMILGREDRAVKVIEYINNTINDLLRRTNNVENNVTVYVGGIGFKGLHGIESTEKRFPPFVFVHANNVVDRLGGTGHVFFDKESLLKWDPDIIFIDEGGLSIVMVDYQKNPQYYLSLKAFKTGRVYGIMPFNYYTTNIGTALADSYYIGKILYPKQFRDVDPAEKADEIYFFLVGKPVYKEMASYWGGFEPLASLFNITSTS